MKPGLKMLIAQLIMILFAVALGIAFSRVPEEAQFLIVIVIGVLSLLTAVATVIIVGRDMLRMKREEPKSPEDGASAPERRHP